MRRPENRVDPRFAAHFDVRFTRSVDASRALNAFSVNFSAGGLCLRSQNPLPVGELIALELSIEDELFHLDGVVAWVRGDAVGVRFVNVSPTVRERLQAVARQLAARPG